MEDNQFDMIVVIPVGPGTQVGFAVDTIDSILFYCRCALKIIVIDDSREGLGSLIKEQRSQVEVLVNKKSNGLGAGLYITLADAYRYIVRQYHCKMVFKVDTDALVTGEDPQQYALSLFNAEPNIGMAGLYKCGNETIDVDGYVFDNRWPRNYMFDVTCTWKIIKRPIANFTLRTYMCRAFRNGFNIGDSIFGGAYFISAALLGTLDKLGQLPDRRLRNSRMEEDHIFSVLAKAAGYQMANLGGEDGILGLAWKALPASPEYLATHKKKVIHSTRSWDQWDENAIRQYFRCIREAEDN